MVHISGKETTAYSHAANIGGNLHLLKEKIIQKEDGKGRIVFCESHLLSLISMKG